MIREIEKDELFLIKELAYKIWPDTFQEILSLEQIEYMLERMYNLNTLALQYEEGHRFFCFENDKGQILGFIAIHQENEQEQLKVHKLYVLANAQQKGIGKSLLQFAFAYAQEKACKLVYLNVNRYNKAIHFYKKMGMVISREEDINIGGGFIIEDFVFEKRI